MRLFQLTLMLMLSTTPVWAHATYTGYSGAPGRQTCAASCHGSGTGTVTISGFPTSYTPGQAYTLTIGHTAGSSIANFNASCRVGTGTTNAGTLTAGTATATYNVSGETNGVHFSSSNQNSGTFTWTSPGVGTGTVRLYAGAHQGSMGSTNNTIVVVSNEVAGAPGVASNPNPPNNATGVAPTVILSWTAGSGATSHDVFFGMTNPPDSVANQTGTSYDPPGDLAAGTTFYWRINERNSIGVTPGPIWQFTTLTAPGEASNPSPGDGSVDIVITTPLSWTAGNGATSHDVFLGTTNPPDSVGNVTVANFTPASHLTPGTIYYWQIRERNSVGMTPGPVWHFTTLSLPAAASDPSPADGDTNVDVHAILTWTGATPPVMHDVYLGTTNPPTLVSQGQPGTSYTPAQSLTEGTLYYWRVDEVNSSGTTQGPVWSFRTQNPNASGDRSTPVPTELALGPVYPNPFNATVIIPFALPQASRVTVVLYDITGRQVTVMANGSFGAGMHTLQWSSKGVGSGIYFVRLTAGIKTLTAKVVALK